MIAASAARAARSGQVAKLVAKVVAKVGPKAAAAMPARAWRRLSKSMLVFRSEGAGVRKEHAKTEKRRMGAPLRLGFKRKLWPVTKEPVGEARDPWPRVGGQAMSCTPCGMIGFFSGHSACAMAMPFSSGARCAGVEAAGSCAARLFICSLTAWLLPLSVDQTAQL